MKTNNRYRLSGVCLLVLVILGGRLMRAQTTLNAALNVPGGLLEFTTSSVQDPSYPWTVVTEPEATHDGAAAARSGATGYYYSSGTYTRSMLSTTLTEPGVLTFWVKKAGQGQLDLRINGGYWQTIEYSGNADGEWRFHQLKLPLTEPTTVQWCFENQASGSLPGQTEHYVLLDEVRWYPADEQGYVFLLNEDGESYVVAAYFGDAAEVNVPATFAGKPVTVIGANAFTGNENLTTVVLPEGLQRIEADAFSFSALSSVTLPSTLQYIGAGAFYGCRLEQLALPAGLTEIGEDAFSWCKLTSIVFAERGGNDITLGDGCFELNVPLRECILPEGITTLPAHMLGGDDFESIDIPAIRIPASVTSLGNLAFNYCDDLVIFFMGPPPAVGAEGLASDPDSLGNAMVVYQAAHQAAWAEGLDEEGRFHGYRTESLTGEPIPLPEISTSGDKTSFIDSVNVIFTLQAPLPGDKLLVERSEDNGATFVQTILTPGESNGGFTAVAGAAQWTYNLTVSAAFRSYAIRPANGTRGVPGYSRCSGTMVRSYLRWNEYADALDNHILEFALEDPQYWSVSTDQFKVGGSSVLVDLGRPEDNPPWMTKLMTQVTGPGLLSCWIYPERESIAVYFGEIDPTGAGFNGFKEDSPIPWQHLPSYFDSPQTWVRCTVAIPEGDFQVGWGFGGWNDGGAAYIDQIQFMKLEGNFAYVVNPDGASATVMAYIDGRGPWEEPIPAVLEIPATLGGLPVTGIGEHAFAGLELASLAIPPSVTTIGDYAFSGCFGMNEIVIPASVTTLGEGVFADYDDLRHVAFLGPRPAAGGDLGGQAAIIFTQGQQGWVDGGTYRGLVTITISGERVEEPIFLRDDVPGSAFMYFNKAFQVTMEADDGPGLTVRYALGGAVPTAAAPGSLYGGVPVELDDPTDDITVSARVFRGGAPCSGVARVTFRNAKELSEILDCFDAIFVLRDPARWQIIEETDEQQQVINRYLQAGPYPEKSSQQAHLDVYVYYPEDELPEKISFQWRLVSTKANPGNFDAGEWKFWLEEHATWSNYKHRTTWQTSNFNVTKGGWLSGTLWFDDYWASQPGISHLKLDRFIVKAPRAVPKVTIDPPGAGAVSYRLTQADDWQPFLGTERWLVGEWIPFRAEPSPGYMLAQWQRYNPDTDQYELYSFDAQANLQIRADEDGDQAENDYKAMFVPAVQLQVTLGEGGTWPWRGNGYAQGNYTEARLVAKDSVLRFYPGVSAGYIFAGWSDGVTEQDRLIVCNQDITLQGNFTRCITSAPQANVDYPGNADDITFTSGAGVLTDLNADGTITYTISVEYPESYRFAGWEFNQDAVDAAQIDGSDLTVTLDWNKTKYFAPQTRFYKQTRLTVRAAAGQEGRGLLQVRKDNNAGEEIVLDEDGGAYIDVGSTLWFKATGLGVNRFERWDYQYGDYSNSRSDAEITMYIWDYPSYLFTASFVAQAPLTLQVDPAGNGTGKFQVNGQDYQPGQRRDIGAQVSIRAIPDQNNRFIKWLDNESANPYRTVYIEPGDNIYTARFGKTGTVTMKAKITTTGEAGGGVANTYTPDVGTDLTITATPYYGYSFVKWEDNDSTEPSRTIHIDGVDNLEYTALYQPVISVSALAPTGGGSFTGTGQKLYDEFPVTVTAVPYSGYRFDRWLDDPAAPAERELTVGAIVNSRINLQAMFVRVCNVVVQPRSGQQQLGAVAITDDGGAEFTLNHDTGTYSAVVDAGTKISYQAIANDGCDFVRWTWDGSKNPVVTDMVIDRSRTFTAVFAQRATINCSVKPGQEAWGAVEMVYEDAPAQSGPNFHVGKWIQIKATPQPNARFRRWNDGSTSAVRNMPVAEGVTEYVAEFVRTSSVTVNLTSDTPGEEPPTMRWGFPWTAWLASGQKVVFDVEDDDGKDCLLQFYGQYGWNLPPEQGNTLKVLPQENLVLDYQYSKITTGTLVGWLNPSNLGAQWRVKANPQTGYPGGEWLGNGASVVLEQGEYEIEFTSVLDEFGFETWHRPDILIVDHGGSATVTVAANQRHNFTGKYRKYIPDLELSFSPGEVSEGAGPSATVATLRRLPRVPGGETDRREKITVAFTPSEAGALIFPSSITIPAERERVQFTVGVVDNDLREVTEILAADGETVLGRGRMLSLNGRVSVPSSCNCDGTPSSGAEISAALAVYDNDGPALQVTVNPSTMQEPEPGADEKLYPNALTVRRNDRAGDGLPAITVALSALVNGEPDDSEFEFRLDGLPVTEVVIPAGELEVTVDIATLDDGEKDGNQLISVYADTDAAPPDEPETKYAPGACWVVVSDLSFPDYVVTSVATPAEPLSGGDVYELEVTLKNQGRMDMTGNIPLAVHASANDMLNDQNRILETNYIGSLEVGQSASLRLNIPLEMAPGANWRFAVVVNPRSTLREVSLLNNTTWSGKFTVEASYRATVELANPAQVTSLMEQPVTLAGRTLRIDSDESVGPVDADVYVIVNGVRRILPVTSDADGNFTVDFTPLPGEAGHVTVGACYPGLGSTVAQDEFDILGLRFVKSVCSENTSTRYVQWGVTMNDVNVCSLQLSNRSPVPLVNLRAQLVDAPANCEVTWDEDGGTDLILDELPGNATRTVMFTVKGTAPTQGRNYQYFTVRVTTDEGVVLDIPAYFHAKPRYAQLALAPTALDVTMQLDPQNNRGTPRNIEVTITNEGADETGPITVSIPSLTWMKLVGSNTLASIQPGESTSFLLTLTADGNTPLNAPLSGTLAINAPNAFAGATLPFRATAVAEGTGSLTVDAIDDYTYYEAHAPHLADALVVVRNPYTNQELARGTTLANGKVTLENLPVGLCKVTVSAEKHAEYTNNVEIQPGRETFLEAFLDYQAITYSWDVVRVEIEDRYEIELTVVYETNVPMPVVETIMPAKMPFLRPGETHTFSAILTNKGLIRADDVEFTLPEVFNSPQCAIAFNYPKGTYSLLPQQAVTIPVVATGVAPTRSSDCRGSSTTLWSWECGFDRKWHRVNKVFSVEGTLCGWDGGSGFGFFGGGGGPVATGPGGSSHVVEPPVPSAPATDSGCTPCTNGIGVALTKCAIGFVPGLGTAVGAIDCLSGVWGAAKKGTAESWTKVGLGCVLTFVEGIPGANVASCALDLIGACDDAVELRGDENVHKPQWLADSQEKLQVVVDLAEQQAAYFREVYGAPCWGDADLEAVRAFFNAFLSLGLPNGIAVQVSDAQKVTLLTVLPEGVEPADLDVFVSRWNRSVAYWETCSMDAFPDYPEGANPKDYLSLKRLYDLSREMARCEDEAKALGYESVQDLYLKVTKYMETELRGTSSVCAQVTIKISQTVSLTREAFEGTLTLFNGHENKNMTNVRLQLVVTDAFGKDCTDLFDISELPERFVELTAINGAGVLGPKTTGSAVVRFIPENAAAPVTSKMYFFGGILSYTNPFSDETATIELTAVPLEVFPGPRLQMHYFLQRDILGDDPLTEAIEPCYPAELSVLIYNPGYGDAKNFRIDSGQPEITGNDKGMLIDFALWDYDLEESTLNGQPNSAPLGQVNLGTIEAGGHGLAQWWMTASLQGHFVGMSATYTHLTSNGNPDICLIDSVDIHELHRSGQDLEGNTAFLVNDISDPQDTPDTLWIGKNFANGAEPTPVEVYDDCTVSGQVFAAGSEDPADPPTYSFTVTPQVGGAWFYVNIPQEALAGYEIVSTARGVEDIPFRNCWLTDRTLPDGADPIYETRLHMFDYFPGNDAQDYVVTLRKKPEVTLEVVSFGGVDGYVVPTALPHIDVFFSDGIRLSTFSAADVTLRRQGQLVSQQELGSLTFEKVAEDDANEIYQYRIGNLGALTMEDGFYVLTVQAAGITNRQGAAGQVGKQVMWVKSTAAYGGVSIARMEKVVVDGMQEGEYQVDIDFNGAVEAASVSRDGLTLTCDGQNVPLGEDVVVSVGELPGQFSFAGIDAYTQGDGVYRLRFDAAASGIIDQGGNASTATKEITWTIDTTPPGHVDGLHIVVDDGIADDDGVTWGRKKTVVGVLPEGGLKVEILYRMTGATVSAPLTSRQFAAGETAMNIPITLPVDGAITLTVRMTDAAGNSTDDSLNIFLDTIPLSAQFADLPDVSPAVTRLLFSAPLLDADQIRAGLSLTVNGSAAGVDLSGLNITPVPGSDREYLLEGLNDCTRVSGMHLLQLNLSVLKKKTSGLPGVGTCSAAWKMLYPLTPEEKLALAQAVNSGWTDFDSAGDAYWVVDEQVSADAPDADPRQSVRSGAVGNGEASVLSLVVPGPGVLSFSWRVSSAAGSDMLAFAINGTVQQAISGVSDDWEVVEMPITGIGDQILTWTYSRGHVAPAGENCGWVDLVSYRKYYDVKFTAANRVYDGTTVAGRTGELVGQGQVEGHEVGVTDANGAYAFATPHQGQRKPVTLTGAELTGADADLYLLRVATGQADITPKAITVGFTADEKVYDGGTAATVRDFVFPGIIDGDALEVTATAHFADSKVGEWVVTIDDGFTITGNDDGNYAINFADDVTASIAPKSMTVGFTADDKVYDGGTAAAVRDFVFPGIVAGDALEVTATAQFADSKAGAWGVTIDDGFTVTGNDDGNYAIDFADNVTASITPKAITVGFTADDKVYDGNVVATVRDFVFPGIIDGDALAVAAATASFAKAKVGAWGVTIDDGFTITGNDDGNYAIAFAPVQASITAKAITVGFTAEDKVYDGNVVATVRDFVFPGIIDGDALEVTATAHFADSKVGEWVVTIDDGFTVTGNDDGNYAINFADNVTAFITAKAITFRFTAEDKEYDGNAVATVRDFDFPGVVDGDVLGVENVTANFAGSKVGEWVVTIDDGFTVTGNDDGNYNLTPAADIKAKITPKLITVGFTADDKVYDGTAVATVHDFVFPGVIEGDALEMAAATASFAESKVGKWAVTIDDGFTVTGNDDGNYAIAFATVQAAITPKAITVGFAADDKVYDGGTAATVRDFVFPDLIGDDTLAMAAATAHFAGSKVGEWAVTIDDGFTITGNDDGNYAINFADNVTAFITPKSMTVGFTADDKVYDGNAVAAVRDFVFPGIVDGDALAVTATAQFADSKVGEWVVAIDDGFAVTGNDDGNYAIDFADNVTASITPKTIAVGFSADDKEYDGTTVATVHDFVFHDVIDGDALAMAAATAQFAEAKVGMWLVTIGDGFTVTGNDDGNYQFSFADDVKAEIRYNVQIIPIGWSMMVMSLDLTAESAASWANLVVWGFKDKVMQSLRDRQPGYGESFWVFNRGNGDVVLEGLKRLDQPDWAPPVSDNAWVMTGPPAKDYTVPEGVQVWVWNGHFFELIPAGEKLPAGRAAWFWQ
ncbi:MAG: leucine-rich repeat protein [Lentisphaerae bacterium]|nr:leucine-rich repeat protein [Lentisphaerota bacterium]